MTDISPRNIIKFPERERPPLRLVPKEDCQGERHVMSALEGSVRQLNPGIDIKTLIEQQAKERLIHRGKEAWRNWCEATDAMLGLREIAGDPAEHMLKYIQDMKGRSAS